MIGVSGRLAIFSHLPEIDFARLTCCQMDEAVARGHARIESDGSNLIVNSGLQACAALIGAALGSPSVGTESPANIGELALSEMQVGNSANPAAPTATDTALEDITPLVTLTSLTYSYPAVGQVRVAATIPVNTQNGEGLTEAGLFYTMNATKIMLGRRILNPTVVVTPGLAYTLRYDITFTAV